VTVECAGGSIDGQSLALHAGGSLLQLSAVPVARQVRVDATAEVRVYPGSQVNEAVDGYRPLFDTSTRPWEGLVREGHGSAAQFIYIIYIYTRTRLMKTEKTSLVGLDCE
jgi:hypothetical protein